MKNINHLRINNKMFTDDFVFVCKELNIKTIGQASKILLKNYSKLRIGKTSIPKLKNELQGILLANIFTQIKD